MQLKDLQAYEILEKRPIKDLNSEGIILRHKKSGARIAVISNVREWHIGCYKCAMLFVQLI